MYYDPMISKLITWAEDREKAMKLLDEAVDHYVIDGVTHNLGFCQSILHNEAYANGSYTTAFIPDYYPEGYSGEKLSVDDHHTLALASFLMQH